MFNIILLFVYYRLYVLMFEQSALDIWSIECRAGSIRSLCKSLDTALGNGFPLGKITEMYGRPGSGKTQIW